MTDSLIHLRIPAATKGRWVRASRAAGMRLTDWIIQAVEAQMQKIIIPAGLHFADLKLARDADGAVSFDWDVVERVCRASGMDANSLLEADESAMAQLLVGWYQQHRQKGGTSDPVAEDLLSEALAEDGQGFSLLPGRA